MLIDYGQDTYYEMYIRQAQRKWHSRGIVYEDGGNYFVNNLRLYYEQSNIIRYDEMISGKSHLTGGNIAPGWTGAVSMALRKDFFTLYEDDKLNDYLEEYVGKVFVDC